MPLTLTSAAFAEGERLPDKHARTGRNISPPLRWSGVPEGTRSLALLVEDPDAPGGTFHHWALFNIPPDWTELPESVETGPARGDLRGALNDFENDFWDGPQPPEGDGPHRYRFRLRALNTTNLTVPAQAGAAAMWDTARKHVIEEAALTGTYEA